MWPSGGLLKGVSKTDSPSVLSLYVFTKSPKQERFSYCSKKWPFTERGGVGGGWLACGAKEERQKQQEAQLDLSPLPLCKSSKKSGWFWCMCFIERRLPRRNWERGKLKRKWEGHTQTAVSTGDSAQPADPTAPPTARPASCTTLSISHLLARPRGRTWSHAFCSSCSSQQSQLNRHLGPGRESRWSITGFTKPTLGTCLSYFFCRKHPPFRSSCL